MLNPSYESMPDDEPHGYTLQKRAIRALAAACAATILLIGFVHRDQAQALPVTELAGHARVAVELPGGFVRGLVSRRYGRIFRGIPYGTAQRWHNPELITELQGDIDATQFRPSCMRGFTRGDEGLSEDCLHLNIYTPIPANGDTDVKIPVLVWFHGGSFTMGAGSDSHAEDVGVLVNTRRVLVVTINYRLGIFGFLGSERLRHGVNDSVGNFGTLDQQTALRWVANNIHRFGGDLDRIGVIGWSAGAASISAHLAMPSSAGLFNRAIMMSGGFTSWAAQTMESAEGDYDDVLQVTGCDTSPQCLEPGPPCPCLMALTADQLVTVQNTVPASWAPTIDGTHLPYHPIDAVERGAVNRGVPIIIGGGNEDGLKDIGATASVQDFETAAGWPGSRGGLGLSPDQVSRLRQIYVDDMEEPTENGLDRWSPGYWAYRRAGADRDMNCVARRAALLWEEASGAPAYWYLWANYPADRYPDPPIAPSHELTVGGCYPCPGATHGSDIPFLFEHNNVKVDGPRVDLADRYQVFFRNLLYTTDPNNWKGLLLGRYQPGSANLGLAWPAVSFGGMRFDSNRSDGASGLVADLKTGECAFWDEVR